MDIIEGVVQEIKSELCLKLNSKFGYCGIAENVEAGIIMLNSGKRNIKIKITWGKGIEEEV